MPQLRTNRDLYLAIDELSRQNKDRGRSLESYLLAMLKRSSAYSDSDALNLDEFYELITAGFLYEPAPFDEVWREQYGQLPHEDNGYPGWLATLIRQIVDLREMEECGTLKNDKRYFGVIAPRNSRWYNFDPAGYLECAMAGSFGGWQSGDNTGRQYVPGKVAVLTPDGSIPSVNPEEVPNQVFQMPVIEWEQFKDFLFCGQVYE